MLYIEQLLLCDSITFQFKNKGVEVCTSETSHANVQMYILHCGAVVSANAYLIVCSISRIKQLRLVQASLDQNVAITAITQEAMLADIASREAAQREDDD